MWCHCPDWSQGFMDLVRARGQSETFVFREAAVNEVELNLKEYTSAVLHQQVC